MTKNLIIAAHPDDEILGCGGTIARLTGKGESAYLLLLSTGRTPDMREQTKQACKAVGLDEDNIWQMYMPDQGFESTPIATLAQRISEAVEKWHPDVVFTHSLSDLNKDHRTAAEATMVACRPHLSTSVCALYAYEVQSSTDVALGQFGQFQPNTFIDIDLNWKLEALAEYSSEMRDYPHPRSYKAIRARATYWGAVAGVEYAEAFQLIWQNLSS